MAHQAITRPLRVLVVSASGVLGGAESWLLSMLDHTDRIEPWVVLLGDGPLRAALTDRGIPVVLHPVGRRPHAIALGAGWLARQLRELDPDVVVGNGIKAQCLVVPAALATGVPSVWVKHDHSYDGTLTRVLGRATGRVVATARQVAVGAGRADTVTITPPRPRQPLARADAVAALRRTGLPAGDRLLLAMPTRLVPYKGVDTAIRALAHPAAAAWDLAVVGPDDPSRPGERARLTALADSLGLAGRVHVRPAVDGVGRLLAGVDAVAVLTRPDGPRTPGREGFGLTGLEAQTAGVPVIAIDDGSPVADRIGPDLAGSAGLLVPPADPDAVAAALGVLADAGTRRAFGAQGRVRSAGHPDAVVQAARFAALLAETARRPGAGLARTEAPPLSVVSPVLQEAATIERLLTTIAEQLGPDDEYLLVDGGSTDGTDRLIAERSSQDNRIRLLRHGGGTIGHSRNVGVNAAKHTFVACTDAGCDPSPGWLDGFRAAAAESTAAARRAEHLDGPAERPLELYVGVYRAAVRDGDWFQRAMAAVSWPDPAELRRSTPLRAAYGRAFGRAFSAGRVDCRSVAFTVDVWSAAGGFPEHLRTAEDEAFGRAVRGAGGRSALTLDAEVTWYQRPTVLATFRQFRGYGQGGGAGRSRALLGRDAVRVGGYVGAAAALRWGGWPGGLTVAAGAAAYLSLPVGRVLRRRHPLAVLPLLPPALLLKDAAKVLGTAEALLGGAGWVGPAGETPPAGPIQLAPPGYRGRHRRPTPLRGAHA